MKIIRLKQLSEKVEALEKEADFMPSIGDVIQWTLSVVGQELAAGNLVVLPGIGSLKVKPVRVQTDLDPATFEDDGNPDTEFEKTILLPRFRCADEFKELLNRAAE